MNSDKVKIKIDGSEETKIRQTKMNPVYDRFEFIPKYAPQLKSKINYVAWESVKRTLVLTIKETSHMEAYKWIKHIKESTEDSQKSTFVDLGQNCAILNIQSRSGDPITSIKFSTLILDKCHCVFHKEPDQGDNSLMYNLESVSYTHLTLPTIYSV